MPFHDVSSNAVAPYWDRVLTKVTNEVVTGSTTLQNDDDLFFPILANILYEFQFAIMYESNGTADFKHDCALSAGTVVRAWRSYDGLGPTTAAPQSAIIADIGTAIQNAGAGTGSGEKEFLWMIGMVTGTADATFNWRWAQNTSDAGNTTVYAGSRLSYRKIG